MAKKNRNSWVGVLIGLAIAFFAIVALWKNETRFNFYAAANNTPTVQSTDDATILELTERVRASALG